MISEKPLTCSIRGKSVTLYGGGRKEDPVVYLNTVRGEGREVWQACRSARCPSFTLAAISGLAWDHDMSPWSVPPIAPGDTPCTGGADDYLRVLTGQIVPAAEELAGIRPRFRAIAGYSLAGLFALYSAFHTKCFTAVASASGSLWFPGFCDYAGSRPFRADLGCVYLSLGDEESRTANPYLAPVQENTRRIAELLRSRGIDCRYELNPGNHFRQPNQRMAKGIAWILNETEGKPYE